METATVRLVDAFENLTDSDRIVTFNTVLECLHESFDQNGLSMEEIATIKAYTFEWEIYPPLNAALRSEKFEKIQPWFPYLKLLDMAVDKLSPKPGTYCRGINANISHLYPAGSIVTWVCKIIQKWFIAQ